MCWFSSVSCYYSQNQWQMCFVWSLQSLWTIHTKHSQFLTNIIHLKTVLICAVQSRHYQYCTSPLCIYFSLVFSLEVLHFAFSFHFLLWYTWSGYYRVKDRYFRKSQVQDKHIYVPPCRAGRFFIVLCGRMDSSQWVVVEEWLLSHCSTLAQAFYIYKFPFLRKQHYSNILSKGNGGRWWNTTSPLNCR